MINPNRKWTASRSLSRTQEEKETDGCVHSEREQKILSSNSRENFWSRLGRVGRILPILLRLEYTNRTTATAISYYDKP